MNRSQLNRLSRLFVGILAAAVLAVSFTAVASAEVAIVKGVNDGAVAKDQTRADTSQCQQYKDWYAQDQKTKEKPTYYKDLAAKRGCNWAQRTVAPIKQPGRVTTEPVGINPGPVTTAPVIDSGAVATPILRMAP